MKVYMCTKAAKISLTLRNMIRCMPKDEDKTIMTKLSRNVFYRSPEVLDEYWNDIYSFVSQTYVDSNSSWQANMRDEYHKGIIKYADEYWV